MYLHKYVQFTGAKEYNAIAPSPVLITALVFLACKATEQLRTIRDVFNVISRVLDESITAKDLDAVRLTLNWYVGIDKALPNLLTSAMRRISSALLRLNTSY